MVPFRSYVLLVVSLITALTSLVQAERPGEQFCHSGYVLDAYRIEEGFLPNNGQAVLKYPYLYEVRDLVDRNESIASQFWILREPVGNEVLYTPEWRFIDNTKFIELAREVGVCDTCNPNGTLISGFFVEVFAIVITMYPPTLDVLVVDLADPRNACKRYSESPTSAPSKSPSQSPTTPAPSLYPTVKPTKGPTLYPTMKPSRSPTLPPTEKPSKSPTSKKPTPLPTSAPTGAPTITPTWAPTGVPEPVDCSKYQDSYQVPELPVTVDYVVNMDDGGKGTFSAQVVYTGIGWVGFGVSPNGGMEGTTAIIGVPPVDEDVAVQKRNTEGTPAKFYLSGRAQELVSLMDSSKQTLQDASIVQNQTHTVLTFTKFLQEDGETAIDGQGINSFVVAIGGDNSFAYHVNRASFLLSLSPCVSDLEEEYREYVDVINVTKNATGYGLPDAVPYEDSSATSEPTTETTTTDPDPSVHETVTINVNGQNVNTGRTADGEGQGNEDGDDSENRPNNRPYEPADAFWAAQNSATPEPTSGTVRLLLRSYLSAYVILSVVVCLFS